MQEANEKTVLGNFANGRFDYAGVSTTFSKRDGDYFVRTDGADGKLAEFRVRYTFGLEPLQQYLIGMPDGRLQALSAAWNIKDRRWFHLYPGERITHTDELHWTRPAQNWNHMCADCHSTGLRKNYDARTNRFDTSWSEISVGCEACHGPGSGHVSWANARRDASSTDATKGLAAQLDERRGVRWTRDATSATATRSQPRSTGREIEVCAQCHARRGQIADGYTAGRPFLDYYRPALLVNPLYYPDGQQRGEVYTWGSFLQSRMHAAGVTCSDCHDPHSGKLRADGNAVCGQCHSPAQFDSPAHHRHRAGGKGAQCAACHMPTTTYMVLDPRHDHSLRVPQPAMSAELGTPNACNACHANRNARWAATQIRAWLKRDPRARQPFATAFAKANAHAIDANAQLRQVADDASFAAIVRATAMSELTPSANAATLDIAAKGLRDPSPLLRLGALGAFDNASPDMALRYVGPLLADPLRAIRIDAARVMAGVPVASMSPADRSAFDRAAAEYVASQSYNADLAEARVNLGSFEARRGDAVRAEQHLKSAIALDPSFVPAYVNLADLYRSLQQEGEAERVLRDGLKQAPNNAALHHALGLALVRTKRREEALQEFALATKLDPSNARFAYVYGVALHSLGRVDAAIATLVKAGAAHPADTDILSALASFNRDRGNEAEARRYSDKLRQVAAQR